MDKSLSNLYVDKGEKIILKFQQQNHFLGYCYKISTNRTNWQTARRLCQNEDAEIVSIRSSIENDFVKGI